MTTYMISSTLQWDPYVLIKNDKIKSFWQNILNNNESTLFILAKGFDPRMNSFTDEIIDSFNLNTKFAIIDIEGNQGPYKDLTSDNWTKLEGKLNLKKVKYEIHNLEMWKPKQNSKTRVGPNKAIDLVNNGLIKGFKNIVIDISSMPRAIYFSLITAILDLSKKQNSEGIITNVFINVVESPLIDEAITSEGVDDKAEFVPRLGGKFMLESDLSDLEGGEKPKIWIPVLGENQKYKLAKIEEIVQPKIICPVLPFPSNRPRRTDDLVLEYREILFDNWLVEQENIIFASESNPFELYRHLMKTAERYFEAFKPIGGCKIAVSSLSSKLLSIGILLTSYEMYRINDKAVGLIHVGGSEYDFDKEKLKKYMKGNENLITLWIDGEPY